MGLFVGLAVAAPVAQTPFFQVKITQGHAGGSQTGYGATISKQKVNFMFNADQSSTKNSWGGQIMKQSVILQIQFSSLVLLLSF